MFDMENPAVVGIVAAIIGSIVGPLLLLLVRNWFNKDSKKVDFSLTLQKITDNIAKDLEEEKEASKERDRQYQQQMKDMEERHRSEISDLTKRLEKAEQAQFGPFVLQTEFITHPNPRIISQSIELVQGE